jgi:phospholipid-binding lipoprotein MlaA
LLTHHLWKKIITGSLLSASLLLSACSSHSPQEAAKQPESSPKAKSELVINSSHGTQTIEPTVVSYSAPNNAQEVSHSENVAFEDPLEFINRPIFAFNDKLFEYVLIPAAKGYTSVVPDPVRNSVSHFFGNIREPLNAINQLLQGELSDSGTSVGRFLINSTVGLLGFFDPATAWFGIDEKVSTINDTLVSYNVGYGSYLVLPILGQSDLRNGFSTITESIFHPIQYAADSPETLYIQSYGGFHAFAPEAPTYEELRKETDDPYVFFRNLYMQSMLRDQQYPAQTQDQQTPEPSLDEDKATSKPSELADDAPASPQE